MCGPIPSAIAGMTGFWNGPVATTTCAARNVSPSVWTVKRAPSRVTLLTRVLCRIGSPNVLA